MELFILAIVVFGLIGFTGYREFLYAKERQDMLDRLMAKDLIDLKVKQEEPGETIIDEEDKEGEDTIPLTTRPLSDKEKEEIHGS
jgi:hypothetical protein